MVRPFCVSEPPTRQPGLDQALRLRPRLLRFRGHRWVASAETIGRPRVAQRFADVAIDIADVLLELANALPDGCSDLRNAPGAEKHQHDDQNHHQFGEAQIAEIHNDSLEERTCNEVGDQHPDKTKQRYVERYTERKLDDPEVDGQWPHRRCDAGREELFGRSGRKQNARRLLDDAPNDEDPMAKTRAWETPAGCLDDPQ